MFPGGEELGSPDELATSVSLESPLDGSGVAEELLLGAVEELPLAPGALVVATPVPLEPLGPVVEEMGPLAPVGPVVTPGAGPVLPNAPELLRAGVGLTLLVLLLAEGNGPGSFEPSFDAHAQKTSPTEL
jgi:hypothetical protein